jgi:phosphatidate cytidylyltransferase
MHLKRWITGIIGAAVLVFLIFIGTRWPFYISIFIASLIALHEFFNIAAKGLPRFLIFFSYALTVVLFIIVAMKQLLLLPAVLFLFIAVPLIFQMVTYASLDKKWNKQDIAGAVVGPLYIPLPLSMLILIDMKPDGNSWIFFLLAVIFAGDTGALYAGKTIGRHKLYSEVSPNKTWEGAAGGLILGIIIALIVLELEIIKGHGISIGVICLAILLSIASQTGDLVESMIKRMYSVKDSGGILPGHGGMLDRIDGLLFAAPVLYVYLALIQW